MELKWINPHNTVQGNLIDTLAAVLLWRNDSLLAELPAKKLSDTLTYFDHVPRPDFYRYSLCAVDTSNRKGSMLYANEGWVGGPLDGIVVWELDPTPISAAALNRACDQLGFDTNKIYTTRNSTKYSLDTSAQAAFVFLGIFPNNHVLTMDEGSRLKSFLDAGGRVYMEGGDTWFFDPPTPVHSYFQIHPIDDGTNDLTRVKGQTWTPYQGMDFIYNGENEWIDRILPTSQSQKILINANTLSGVGVAYDAGSYKTIGTSFEIGGLVDGVEPSTKKYLFRVIMNYMDITITGIKPDVTYNKVPESFQLKQNYPNPFNPATTIEYEIPVSTHVKIEVFSILGEKAATLIDEHIAAGSHQVQFNGAHFSNGVYFYRIQAEDYVDVKKMVLMK